jgi:CheY-like chemotaxis protein/anti-sigma regulatory factor (Ser/Thr protein kinase)
MTFNAKEEFELLYTLYNQNALEKGVHLINAISPDLPEFLEYDILRIKQIVSNLLSNAIKFTPIGKNVRLIIEFCKDTSSLFFEVIDEGIGISKENLEYITQPFTQADSSTAREYGGTGLGLSIVTKLLNLMDSKLIIKSELNKGSSFSFSIKVTQRTNIFPTQEHHSISFTNTKVLVAEDNKTNQMLINILLQDLGVHVFIVNNGVEAETIFQKEHFDLVLLDINMPLKNGVDTMLSIRKYQKEHALTTPIIALTANAVSGDKQKFLEIGFDDYLSKPIDVEQLAQTLSQYVKTSSD